MKKVSPNLKLIIVIFAVVLFLIVVFAFFMHPKDNFTDDTNDTIGNADDTTENEDFSDTTGDDGFSINLMPVATTNQNKNGVDIVADGEGTYTLSGTCTSYTTYKIYGSRTELPNGIVSGKKYRIVLNSTASLHTCVYYCKGANTEFISLVASNEKVNVFTIPSNATGLMITFSVLTSQNYNDTAIYELFDIEVTDKKVAHFGWIDDDGKEFVYTSLYPWAVENAVPFTSALITNHIAEGKKGWMSIEQVKEMYVAHPELVSFGSHTRDHINATNMIKNDIENQIRGSKLDIEGWGIPCELMIYPNGQISDAMLEIVSREYKYGFQAGGADGDAGTRVNFLPFDLYKIKRRTIGQTANVELLKAEIDKTIEYGGVLIFMSHVNSAYSGNVDSKLEFAVYDEIVSYIREAGYDIESVEKILNEYVG